MRNDRLRVAIVGAGQIVEVTHLPILSSMREELDLVGIADIVPERAERLAMKFGVERAFHDYEEMLSTLKPDAALVCTPNRFHAAATVTALRTGCHVFCEKPPAMNKEEVRRMMVASRKSGRILSFNFNYRYRREAIAIKKFVDNGDLGEVYHCEGNFLRRRGVPGWGSFSSKEIQGGGPLMDIGVHMLDLALFMMGFPEPESVTASTYCKIGNKKGVGLMGSWDPGKFKVEDSAFGFVKFTNGASLILKTAFALNMKDRSNVNLQIFGDKAGATVFPPEVFTEIHGELADISLPFVEDDNCYMRSLGAFFDRCREGSSEFPTPEQAYLLQSLLDAFYESAESGSAVIFERGSM